MQGTVPLTETQYLSRENQLPELPEKTSERLRGGISSPPKSVRNRLPDERRSITHKFQVGSHEGYLVVGFYPDGQPGEIFITMAKEGSTVSGLINSFAQAISIGLQHGVPLRVYCEKFSFTRFEPSGWTGNPAIPKAMSVMDYVGEIFMRRSAAVGPEEKKVARINCAKRHIN